MHGRVERVAAIDAAQQRAAMQGELHDGQQQRRAQQPRSHLRQRFEQREGEQQHAEREQPQAGLVASRGLVFGEVMVFVVLLTLGFVYAWRKGVFRWR